MRGIILGLGLWSVVGAVEARCNLATGYDTDPTHPMQRCSAAELSAERQQRATEQQLERIEQKLGTLGRSGGGASETDLLTENARLRAEVETWKRHSDNFRDMWLYYSRTVGEVCSLVRETPEGRKICFRPPPWAKDFRESLVDEKLVDKPLN